MQVIRLSRKEQKRNILEKIIEIVLSTRLELRLKKEEILIYIAQMLHLGVMWSAWKLLPGDTSAGDLQNYPGPNRQHWQFYQTRLPL